MDGVHPETCAECRFDSRRWRLRDAATLLDALGVWWDRATRDIDPAALNTRPAPAVWSVLEYGVHTSFVVAVLREGVERMLAEDGTVLPPSPVARDADPGDDPAALDRDAVVADLTREGQALAALTRSAPVDAWTNTGVHGDHSLQAEATLIHAVHDATHHQMDVARGLSSLGVGTRPQTGTVLQVNASTGGVPKRPLADAEIDGDGIVGDRQADGKHHGRPFQALSLWSAEVIDQLARDGHPIGPGSAGENITIRGIDWAGVRPGTRLRVGTALAEVSFPATPCHKQTGWFADGDFGRIDYERNAHLTRWYAWVREPGAVKAGDPVVVQP